MTTSEVGELTAKNLVAYWQKLPKLWRGVSMTHQSCIIPGQFKLGRFDIISMASGQEGRINITDVLSQRSIQAQPTNQVGTMSDGNSNSKTERKASSPPPNSFYSTQAMATSPWICLPTNSRPCQR